MKKYKTILADPPWYVGTIGRGKDLRPGRVVSPTLHIPIRYDYMKVSDICDLSVGDVCDDDCHLWLWTTNRNLHDSFHVMESWGFKYHGIITWHKPAGVGAYLINKTQHLLLGYKGKFYVNRDGRYIPTIQKFIPKKHSEKPIYAYELIEKFSYPPYLELFARNKRDGWDVWGNEVESDIDLTGDLYAIHAG
jgi:N6-adenosine-specific RNA methylase IME4